jgi:hypothetical protein
MIKINKHVKTKILKRRIISFFEKLNRGKSKGKTRKDSACSIFFNASGIFSDQKVPKTNSTNIHIEGTKYSLQYKNLFDQLCFGRRKRLTITNSIITLDIKFVPKGIVKNNKPNT